MALDSPDHLKIANLNLIEIRAIPCIHSMKHAKDTFYVRVIEFTRKNLGEMAVSELRDLSFDRLYELVKQWIDSFHVDVDEPAPNFEIYYGDFPRDLKYIGNDDDLKKALQAMMLARGGPSPQFMDSDYPGDFMLGLYIHTLCSLLHYCPSEC